MGHRCHPLLLGMERGDCWQVFVSFLVCNRKKARTIRPRKIFRAAAKERP